MSDDYNIYIDESCHLENDRLPVMAIGYCKIRAEEYYSLKEEIQKIKLRWKNPTEIKWNTVSYSRIKLYKELIDCFFSRKIYFRCVLVVNKSCLNHSKFNDNDHNNFYYKLIYQLLSTPNNAAENRYRVLIDIKDTKGKNRLKKVSSVLDSKYYGNSPFIDFQNIHSHENEFLQLADLFIGSITYKSRKEHLKENASKVKCSIIDYIEFKTKHKLDEPTSLYESKFNIFHLKLSEGN